MGDCCRHIPQGHRVLVPSLISALCSHPRTSQRGCHCAQLMEKAAELPHCGGAAWQDDEVLGGSCLDISPLKPDLRKVASGSLSIGPYPSKSDFHSRTSTMTPLIANFSEFLDTKADLLRPCFPRAGYGLKEAGSVKLEPEVKSEPINIWSLKLETTQMKPEWNNVCRRVQLKRCWLILYLPSPEFYFTFLKKIYLFKRERDSIRGRGREREVPKHFTYWAWRPRQGLIPWPWHHNLSWTWDLVVQMTVPPRCPIVLMFQISSTSSSSYSSQNPTYVAHHVLCTQWASFLVNRMKVGKSGEKAKHENIYWLLTTISLRSFNRTAFSPWSQNPLTKSHQ